MKVDFDTARYFWECYCHDQPGWFLPSKSFTKIRQLMKWTENPPTVEGFEKAYYRSIDREIESHTDSNLQLSPEELAQHQREIAENTENTDDADAK